jgi:site-specific DNA-methyltransferase (adenine-specific)
MAEQERYTFILGDCIEKLKEQNAKSVDCVITSPPYNIGLKYNKYEDKKPRDQYLEWIYDIFVEIKRILKDDGHIFLNIGYTNTDPWIAMEVALKLKDLFILQNKITWVKSVSIGDGADDTHGHFKPINSNRYITPTNEEIFHFTKSGNEPIDRKIIGVPYKYKCNLKERSKKKNKVGELKEDKRCKGNTWFIPYKTISSKKEKGHHPATYPLELVEHCVKLSNKKEGVVLDPFIGSGTTLKAIKNLNDNEEGYNLNGIGIDIDEKYLDFARAQVEEEVEVEED